jgi:hypothetical protein
MSMQWPRSDGEVSMLQCEWGRNTTCSGLEATVTQMRRVFTQTDHHVATGLAVGFARARKSETRANDWPRGALVSRHA